MNLFGSVDGFVGSMLYSATISFTFNGLRSSFEVEYQLSGMIGGWFCTGQGWLFFQFPGHIA